MELMVNIDRIQYPISIEKGLFDHILDKMSAFQAHQKIVIISDENVYPLYGKKIKQQLQQRYDVSSIVLKPGEETKSFEQVLPLYQKLVSLHISRSDVIMAIGGGVIGDLAGFIASTYLRGIAFIQVPTSLLAQVDSSVGGKVAVDLPEGKNLVGAFKHPQMVLIDPLALLTLDKRYIADGMAEVIKYGCILKASFFEQLASYPDFDALFEDIEDVIYRCVDLKRQVVEEDVYDFGKRMLLNFGHTLGHAIEQYYHYQRYSHGEAVAIGMVQMTRLSEQCGLTSLGCAKRIEDVVKHYHLPISASLSSTCLLDALSRDKKNLNHRLSYIVLKDIGEASIHQDDLSFVEHMEVI